MIPFNRLEQVIPDLTSLVVITTTISAFALSFFNLQAAALQAGINPWLSWLWPICIDAVLCAGSLMILRSSLRGEPTTVGWSVLLSFTAISTMFNILHSPDDIFSRSAHAIPPLALCVSIEVLMLIIRSDLTSQRSNIEPTSPDHPDEQADQKPETDQQNRGRIRIMVEDDEIIDLFNSNPGISLTKAASAIGISRVTLSKRVTALEKSNRLSRETVPYYQSGGDTGIRTDGSI